AGVVLLALFPLVEARATEPILPLELFRNRIFTVTSAVGFIVGLALFGSVTYLPLYLQVVKGQSPTASGLQLTPLMGGVLVTSILSGNLISKFGRYKPFPIAGTALMTVGLYLLSRLAVATPTWVAGAYMVILGLGLGMVMQVLVLAAQNAVDYRLLGVATSGSTLFRQVGGSIGVSVFGAIFSNKLGHELATRLPRGDERTRIYRQLIARSGVEITPGETWLLARLRDRAPVTAAGLADGLRVPEERVADLAGELHRRGLLTDDADSLQLSDDGRAAV